MASTNWDTDRKGKASCLGATKLFLAVGVLHIVVGSIEEEVTVSGGSWLLGSII